MKQINLTLYFILTLFLIGCASTRMTSFKDPDYQKADFKRILIIANTSDLEKRQKLESKMVEEFTEIGVFALESYNLFPPTRELSAQDKIELLNQNGIDSFISIDVGESGINKVTVPVTSTTTKTKGNVNVYGNTANYKEKSTTTYQGGQTYSKPWADYETSFYDVTNGRMAWIASSHTGGNAYANFNTVMNSYCSEVVEKLVEDKLITDKTNTK